MEVGGGGNSETPIMNIVSDTLIAVFLYIFSLLKFNLHAKRSQTLHFSLTAVSSTTQLTEVEHVTWNNTQIKFQL